MENIKLANELRVKAIYDNIICKSEDIDIEKGVDNKQVKLSLRNLSSLGF